jgi:hypothetical protein
MTMANQKAQYTEDAIGQNHPTLADTVNRLVVGVNNFRLIKSGGTLTLEPVNGNLVDINGDVYAVTTLPTLAAPDTKIQIEAMTRAAACVVTWTGHGFTAKLGQKVFFASITQAGWTALNGNTYEITYVGANSFSIAVNTSGYAGDYVPGTDPGTIDKETTYYVYLYSNSSTATLEASTTGYTVDTKGRANKTGTATRRLMGMARTISGPAWVDTEAQRFVVSRDNRRKIQAVNAMTANRNTASATFVEICIATERAEFLAWADSAVAVFQTGSFSNGTAGNAMYAAIGIDSIIQIDGGHPVSAPVAGYGLPIGVTALKVVTDGYHFATVLGRTSAGTTTWAGSATAGERTTSLVEVRG